MEMSVDDVPERLVRDRFRKLLDGSDNLIRHLGRSRVNHQNAIVAYLDGNITDSANEHVNVALHFEDVDLRVLVLLGIGGCTRQDEQKQKFQISHLAAFIFS
jgi:hypothetical protein